MRRFFFIPVVATVLAAFMSYGQEVIDASGAPAEPDNSVIEPNSPASNTIDAEGDVVRIDAVTCRRYQPGLDSAAADYVPGVGADGKKVASAEVPNQSSVKMPTDVVVPLTYDIARTANLPRGAQMRAPLGIVAVEDGQVSFNGQPIGGDSDADLLAACRRAGLVSDKSRPHADRQ